VIDYDLVAAFMPTLAIGSGIGVLLNRVLSPFIICLAIALSLLYTGNNALKKATSLRKNEK